jgi:SAM-dependent methyltransferase
MLTRLWTWLFPSRAEQQQTVRDEDQPGAAPAGESDGRRRLRDVPYLLPKDLEEAHRLDFQHYAMRLALGKLTFAPVEELLRQGGQVLDVGCGTGRWAIDLAQLYPLTQITGLDLEVVKATTPPPNYRFVQGNLLKGLPFADSTFVYTHQRFLVAAIPLEQWPRVVHELYRVTAPGGWIELIELGAETRNAGPCLQQLIAWARQLAAMRGIDGTQMSRMAVAGWLPPEPHRHPLAASWYLGGAPGSAIASGLLERVRWSRRPGCPRLRHQPRAISPNRCRS